MRPLGEKYEALNDGVPAFAVPGKLCGIVLYQGTTLSRAEKPLLFE
jgi:hypothetical protein